MLDDDFKSLSIVYQLIILVIYEKIDLFSIVSRMFFIFSCQVILNNIG